MQGLHCIESNGMLATAAASHEFTGQQLLDIELSQGCYEGGHLGIAIMLWFILFVYCLGFPFWCLYLVNRKIKGKLARDKVNKRFSQYGYLFRDVKEKYIWFRCIGFIV